MSTTDQPTPVTPSRRLRWLLIGSLAINVLVLGSVAGLSLRHFGDMPRPHAGAQAGGGGPWSGGLTRADHKALRRAFDAEGYDFRADFRADREDRARLLAGLRAEPFEPQAMQAITADLEARAGARMALGNRLILEYITEMTPEERRAMADRMEAAEAARRAARHNGARDRPRD